MTAHIIDGKAIAAGLRARVADEVARVKHAHGLTPGLAVVLVGNDPASEVYVRSKHRETQAAGMASFEHRLAADVSQDELMALIARLNRDAGVHGILVQLPLPKSINAETVINAIDPAKDVDGLHPANAGRLAGGFAALAPCTPLGCIILTKSVHASLEGMNAIVLGRSNLVGRPLLQLLLSENATVTIAHSRSRELPKLCAQADLVYAAVGRPEMVRGNWIKPGATVIDVGTTRVDDRREVERIFANLPQKLSLFEKNANILVGDVHPVDIAEVAGAYTPVPGGVGPLTIAMLMANTVASAERRQGVC